MDQQPKARILLVDDEPAISRIMNMYLSKLGYQVDCAATATEAFSVSGSAAKPYDLLIADLTLPDVPGQEMAMQMVQSNPNLRVLLCSGYPFAVESLPEPLQQRFSSLQKPFLPNMLVEAVEEVLRRPSE